jgi:GNAT superfamily N-acetyltransferase
MSEARTPHPYIESRFPQPLEMVRPSRTRVDAGSPPAGYRLRPFDPGADAPGYHDLFRLAWPDEGMLPHTLAHALAGGFLLVEHRPTGKLVGSCVAFGPETPSHGANGSLGWLVVDPAHGGRGLGKLLAAAVTNRLLDERYALPWLQTEDDRLAALHIYLALGWEPYLYAEDMHDRWCDIDERLRKA